ncbi:MAG: hypothetical protein KKF44_10375, partial [Nanoarchaeota archaeon]|nr:hypothetical protein [Nanoarchaeota archaeon]
FFGFEDTTCQKLFRCGDTDRFFSGKNFINKTIFQSWIMGKKDKKKGKVAKKRNKDASSPDTKKKTNHFFQRSLNPI